MLEGTRDCTRGNPWAGRGVIAGHDVGIDGKTHHKLTETVTVPVTEILYRNGVTGGLTDRNRG